MAAAFSRKQKEIYVCSECGSKFPCSYGKCPSCMSWGTIEAERVDIAIEPGRHRSLADLVKNCGNLVVPEKIPTNVNEFDRVLGGGLTEGMALLLAGEPGVGKSTLLMQICLAMSKAGHKVLYYSGEESAHQIFGRARRLSDNETDFDNLDLITDVSVEEALLSLPEHDFLIVDSIQMVKSFSCDSLQGTPGQIKTSAGIIINEIKRLNIPCVIVGHITKDGDIAGPKFLEHMVDGVFVFESDIAGQYRMLQSLKNRYGGTDETGIFEMTEKGLMSVDDPSKSFWEKREEGIPPGIAFSIALAGNRPLCVEIQSLMVPTTFPYPKRTATGFNIQRMQMLLAVMERHAGIGATTSDAYVNLTSGFAEKDTGIDLAVVASCISSLSGESVPGDMCFIGEVGLAGEIRPVSRMSLRVVEAERLGFSKIMIAEKVKKKDYQKNEKVFGVTTISSVGKLLKVN